ncbi:MAG: 5-nucleotidase, partial [Betaproteobacteria bacterium]|nr:5-nucleotidase [Betaproteobacteria bacterium]
MAFQIENKLVIGVASSALFDLTGSHQVYLDSGPEAYRSYQEDNLDLILGKGVAFPFIRRFLNINKCFPRQMPVEVVLFSRNSPETGLRVMRSIAHYGLDISRAAFMTGKSPYPYLPAFNTSLFLSANEEDVKNAIAANYPAGLVLPSKIVDDDDDIELRVAFDFDGVIADDEAETVFKKNNDLEEFHAHETRHVATPHQPGPLADMFQKLALMQRMEERAQRRDPAYRKILRIAIITARNAPSHERVVTTLKSWGVSANETFFLGGMDKARVL